jgi:glycosyltransferase involved in cell wall biosynthesis
MRVLQVISDNDRRGAQVFAKDLGDALARRGHDVSTCALVAAHGEADLGFAVLGPSRTSLRGQLALRRFARRSDVVIAHGSSTAQATTVSLGRTRTPVVYRQISDSLRWAPTWHHRARVRTYLRQMTAVVALHEDAARTLTRALAVPVEKITVVPNGVVTAEFVAAPVPHNVTASPRVIYLGALTEEKGVLLLPEMTRRLPTCTIRVVGDGPLRHRLEETAPPNLQVIGPTDDPAGELRSADVFVFPSSWGDSMPAVLIEAGLTGLPVVATDVGAARVLVADGLSGTIVAPDGVDALTDAVRAVVESPPDERQRMGAAGRAHCLERFDIDVVAEAWEQVLLRAVH